MKTNISYWLDNTAKKYANKKMFCEKGRSVTFGQFRVNALNIATALVRKDLFKMPIAIYMDKCIEEIEAFLGVAYSGNFYSPIDVQMPVSRVEKIMEVFSPKVILTKTEFFHKIKENFQDVEIMCIDDLGIDEPDIENVFSQRGKCCDRDLLYILFTSGSTGIPKGVTICHQSVIDYIEWVEEEFQMNEATVFGNQSPFYFDNSILDIYITVKCGATAHIIPHELFAWPKLLLEYIKDNDINTIFWVPSAMVLASKLKALEKVNLRGRLNKILFAGEVMPNKHLNVWRKYIPDALYANLYGPTEITDVCSFYVIDRDFNNDEPLPIGKSVKNTDIIILNENNELAQKGEEGELCVRGTSLSMGYYKNPEKTSQVFVQNPLNHDYIELIYRTGDLVKVNELDEIIYIGRKDFQIKHMGHRIELGEIESAIISLDVTPVCCCLYDEKKERIVAFMEGMEEIPDLNGKLKSILPEYMIPGKYIFMEIIPLNMNGKIDRAELRKMV